jgi:beta-phosphoglucomutase-like phosphatase (HAD superfamily)
VLEACRRLGLAPEEAAAFETTRAGVEAGRAAGVDRIVVVRRESLAPSAGVWGADRVVSDLAELIDRELV